MTEHKQQDVVNKIAEVAAAMGFQAGEPAAELAGHIVSFLYANPEHLDRFMSEGTSFFIHSKPGQPGLFEGGCLSYRAVNGSIMTPSERRRQKGQQQ